jgi:hypothetical protein
VQCQAGLGDFAGDRAEISEAIVFDSQRGLDAAIVDAGLSQKALALVEDVR